MREYINAPHIIELLKDTHPDVLDYVKSIEDELVHIMTLTLTFMDGNDPLNNSPWNSMDDLREDLNKSIEHINGLK
ncbi:hypothetical protein GKQ23_13090 [Erwinia sp. E602]|nr:hypothetical protein GKQ23_13090 [Erwinia sp. E602]